MPDSTYKVIELVGSSEKGWEDAVNNAVIKASETLRDIRVCEVLKLDTKIADNKIVAYRARVNISFKFEGKA
jgi:flavin-binding protein dodecin